jgi:16S rRNA (cytosine1402-N4)-methyltransferase
MKALYDYHKPVMPVEVIEYLITDKNALYIDATLGGGGHTELILNLLEKNGRLISFDTDIDAINHVEKKFEDKNDIKERLILINENFSQLKESLDKIKIERKVQGILFDLGVSSFQLDSPDKGFTYKYDSLLDMRMNKNRGVPAYNILNTYSQSELERVFREYAEDKYSKSLAKLVISRRSQKLFKTSNDFVDVIKSFISEKKLNSVLSRLFQALRIETNDEMENLYNGLNQSLDILNEGGRLVVLTYHSLEDRIVKNFFKNEERPCTCPPSFPQCICGKKQKLKIITRKPLLPSDNEISDNIRARSAKLRVAERV